MYFPARRAHFSLLLFLALWAVTLGLAAAPDPSENPAAVDSPWTQGHRTPAVQASSPYTGPLGPAPQVQVSRFADDAGIAFGASPWHVLSSKRYSDDPNARTVWGSSLEYVYKYVVSGSELLFADSFRTNFLPTWIGWNIFGMAGDRFIVPDPNGYQVRPGVCNGNVPALLEFRDGDTSNSRIECVKKFEFTEERLLAACGFSTTGIFNTGTGNALLYTGDVAAQVVDRETGASYMVIIDNALEEIRTCAFVDDTDSTNKWPVERISETRNALFVATEGGVVKMVYDSAANTLTRVWKQTYPFRAGRTGATPTLIGLGEDRFVVTVDARCAVQDPFTGVIECDPDTSPSRLVAFRRDDEPGPITTYDLPDYIDTVENSPAGLGLSLVVCDYSGYTPDGEKDGAPDFATGIARVTWDPVVQTWGTAEDWDSETYQCSGVPTISAASNRVYFSGSEGPERNTYQYAMRFKTDGEGPGGELVTRVLVGPSYESSPGAEDQLFDQGNNIIVNDDGSILWSAETALVRVLESSPESAAFVSEGSLGPPLVVQKAGPSSLRVSWSVSCADPTDDYALYEGPLGDYAALTPITCSTGRALSWTFEPQSGARFYLAVPRVQAAEGSYGRRSDGNERAPSASACAPQSVATCP